MKRPEALDGLVNRSTNPRECAELLVIHLRLMRKAHGVSAIDVYDRLSQETRDELMIKHWQGLSPSLARAVRSIPQRPQWAERLVGVIEEYCASIGAHEQEREVVGYLLARSRVR